MPRIGKGGMREIYVIDDRSPDSKRALKFLPDGFTGDPERMAGAQFSFWSSDGRSIGVFAGGKLKRTGIAGELPQVLASASNSRGGTWDRDDAGGYDYALSRSASGEDAIAITRLAGKCN